MNDEPVYRLCFIASTHPTQSARVKNFNDTIKFLIGVCNRSNEKVSLFLFFAILSLYLHLFSFFLRMVPMSAMRAIDVTVDGALIICIKSVGPKHIG